jgi:hypothetical protein
VRVAAAAGSGIAAAVAVVAAAGGAVVVVSVFPSFRCRLRLPRQSGHRFVRRLRRSRGVQRYIPALCPQRINLGWPGSFIIRERKETGREVRGVACRALPCAPDRAMGRNSASECRDVGIPAVPWVLLPHSVVSETPMRLAGLVLLLMGSCANWLGLSDWFL